MKKNELVGSNQPIRKPKCHLPAVPKSTWLPMIAISLSMFIMLTGISLSQDSDPPKVEPKDHVSYILGHTIGKMIAHTGISLKSLKPEDFILGMEESIDGKPLSLSEKEVVKAYQTIRERGEANKKRSDIDMAKKAKQYIQDLTSKPDVTKLPSGALYEVLNEGTGPAPKNGQGVTYSWVTKRVDGTTIDSSDRRKATASFTLTDSVKSSEEGKSPTDALAKEIFPRMKKGSKWKITIPPELAYGPKGNPPFIQPYEVLSIEIEVLQVSDPSK
jgi:FKBP-type peptidyl-prolyl cis-trans isomerase